MEFTRIRGEKVNACEGNEALRHTGAGASGGQDTSNARAYIRRGEWRARYEECACVQYTLWKD